MEQLVLFIKRASSDEEIKAKIDALGDRKNDADAIISIAAEYGFVFTAEDFNQRMTNTELNEEELEAVAGGGGDVFSCKFKSEYNVIYPKVINGVLRAECCHWCWAVAYCACRHTPACVDNWHRVYSDESLWHNWHK